MSASWKTQKGESRTGYASKHPGCQGRRLPLILFWCQARVCLRGPVLETIKFKLNKQVDSPQQLVGKSTSSDETFNLIKRWISNCRDTHPTCNPRAASGLDWYPTRLVNIREQAGLACRLQIASEEHPTGPYVTLSHCWGNHQPLTLTQENLQTMKSEIPWSSLPKTFRDAITIARKLGLDYIWIDSLCIQQSGLGSREDWTRECELMSKVYALAAFNIAATSAKDSRDGCFFEREPALIQSHTVSVDWDATSHGRYDVSFWPSLWDKEVRDAPLAGRGWVLQERILAPRVLHFSSRQVFWECCELEASETFPNGDPQNFIGGRLKANDFHSLIGPKQRQHRTSGLMWRRIFTAYTSCLLSKEDDRLVALSGIAEHFGEGLGLEYLAGLWKSHLPCALLWVVPRGAISHRPKSYRAPSWSWASVEAASAGNNISADSDNQLLHAEMLHSEVTTSNGHSYGEVITGHLIIKGPLAQGKYTHREGKNGRGRFDLENLSQAELSLFLDDNVGSYDPYIYCLAIQSWVAPNRERSLIGLVLAPLDTPKSRFRRMGLWEVRGSNCVLMLEPSSQNVTIV